MITLTPERGAGHEPPNDSQDRQLVVDDQEYRSADYGFMHSCLKT